MKLQDPRDRCHGPGAWPTSTRRCVDVEERRGDQPAPESGRARIAGNDRATPPQARADYNKHTAGCPVCRDIDRERCGKGNTLWRAWEAACDDAFQRLGDAIRQT